VCAHTNKAFVRAKSEVIRYVLVILGFFSRKSFVVLLKRCNFAQDLEIIIINPFRF